MNRYNHVDELSSELNGKGYEKDRDVTCPADHDPYHSCLRDSHGNSLYSCEECKSYYIIEQKSSK